MRHLRIQGRPVLRAIAVCLSAGAFAAHAQSPATDRQQEPACAEAPPTATTCREGTLQLRKASWDIAAMICSQGTAGRPQRCVTDMIRKLGAMTPGERCDSLAIKALLIRQQIAGMVMTASLQVDGFQAAVDSEIAEIRQVHDSLTDRRDAAVGRSTLGSAVGTGGGAVASSLALAARAAVTTAGGWVGAFSDGLATVFGFLGYYQAHGPRGCFPDVKFPAVQCRELKYPVDVPKTADDPCNSQPDASCSPTMLYLLFNPNGKIGFHSEYDPLIAKYLDCPVQPGGQTSRREALIVDQWKIDKKAMNNPLLIPGKLIAHNASPRKLSIDELDDRANMLADLRAVVSRISRDLAILTEDLSTGLVCD